MSKSEPRDFTRRAGFLLATVGRRADSAWTGFLHGQGVTNAEFAALSVLAGRSLSQRAVAERMAVDPRNAGAILRKLRGRGWVSAQADPTDARRVRLTLTDDGARTLETILEVLPRERGAFFGAVSAQELLDLERILNKINDSFVTPEQPDPSPVERS